MQRLELKHRGKFLGAPQLVADYVRSDFGCERKRKSHKVRILPGGARGVNELARLYCESASGGYLDLNEDSSELVPNSKINLRLRWICVVK